MLRVHFLHLIGGGIARHIPMHVCDIAFSRKRATHHVVSYAVCFPHNMMVRHWSSKDSFGMLDILDRPVDGVSLGFLVDLKHEAYQELAIAKDPDWESEVWARVDQ